MAIVPIIIPPEEKPAVDPDCLLQYKTDYGWECLRTQEQVDRYKAEIDRKTKEDNEAVMWFFWAVGKTIFFLLMFLLCLGALVEYVDKKIRCKKDF